MTSPPRTPAPSPLTANPVPAKVSVSMHATPPVAAPPSASVQRRQIALVAAAAVLAFALAFGIGKAVSSGPETSTAAPERPQAIKGAAVSVAAAQARAGATAAFKARARRHKGPQAASSNTSNPGTSSNGTQQQ